MNVDAILERMHVPMAVTSTQQPKGEDMFENNISSKVIVMREWGLAVFTLFKLTGAVGTATVTLESCNTIVPGVATAVAFRYRKMTTNDTFGAWTECASTGVTVTAGADQVWQFAVQANELVAGDIGVRFVATEGDSTAVDGGVVCTLYNPKYAKSIPNTVLA